ncbi:hypothetical protein OKA04_21330 [Luteolibacter flavescens]|uniref:Uncharacterized protein n=1 Tax=Luteolibacter flavescens TaxID=1859460 RepID=A0ABT3FVF6_9BACT|nr:hypothetical protein [Luteolibacter flavescens]MCW1887294.1 hypothetical protein [Luteolibacter flavescens]
MLSLIHHGAVISRIAEVEPARPELWTRGQIVYFTIDAPRLGDDVEDAFLVNRAGFVWHVEVLASGPPRDSASPAMAGVIVRILRKTEATPALMHLVGSGQAPTLVSIPAIYGGDEIAAKAS